MEFRLKRNQKKNDDNTAADSHSAGSINRIEESGKCASDKNQDDVESVNADTKDLEIKTNDVPDKSDSQNNHDYSLGENETNTLSSNNNTTETESQTPNSANSFGGCEFIRKQGNRRLRTPVWARCSIIQIYSFSFFLFDFSVFSPYHRNKYFRTKTRTH